MTFAEVKTEILLRARRLEVCDAYYDIMKSTNFSELLGVSCGMHLWAYRSNVVDDTLLLEFPEVDLNTYGIYTTGSVSITNPETEDYLGCHGNAILLESAPDQPQTIYGVNNANITLVLNGPGNCNLYLMGGSTVNATLSNDSKLELYVYDTSTAIITLSNKSLLCLHTKGSGIINIYAHDDTISLVDTNSTSHVTYQGNENSYANLNSYGNSLIEYLLNDSSSIDKVARFQSKIIPAVV